MGKRKAKLVATDPPEVIDLFDSIASLFPNSDGFDGVIVIFPENLTKTNGVTVLRADQLPN